MLAQLYLLALSSRNIILGKRIGIKLWEPIKFLAVYIKWYLVEQELRTSRGQFLLIGASEVKNE